MAIKFKCSRCNKTLQVDDRHAGEKIRCPKCGVITIAPRAIVSAQNQNAEKMAADKEQAKRDGGVHCSKKKEKQSKATPLHSFEEIEPIRFVKRKTHDDELDMTPMVDVTFLLLIFFMVTAAFSLQKSLQVPTPGDDKAVSQQSYIDPEEGNVVVRIDRDSTVWVNDSEAPSEQDLLVKLREAREAGPADDSLPINSLLVMVDGDALHEVVIMVLDAGNSLKMEPIRMATMDEDDF